MEPLINYNQLFLAVKIAENKFKVARTAAEALQAVPKVIDVTSVGVGTTHSFTAKNLNSKALITLDNNIQSPVIQSPVKCQTIIRCSVRN